MTICVTGGAGFIGKPLVNALEKSGQSVRILTRHINNVATNEGMTTYFKSDLSQSALNLKEFLSGANVLYHCAGEIKNETKMHALHVEGTQRLLDAVQEHIRTTQQAFHWVQLSSVGAYGPPLHRARQQRTVTEDSPTHPVGTYEVTKTQSDELVMRLAATEPLFSYSILRPSIVIADNMPNGSVRALASMMRKGLFFYIGSRSSIANYVHLNDVIDALLLCGSDNRARGQIFNLSNDCLWTDIVKMVRNNANKLSSGFCVPELPLRCVVAMTPKFVKSPLSMDRIDALVRHTSYPTNKLKQVLGFEPKVDIPTAINKMV